jgi:SAM-dependent methyltransferase
LQVRVLQGAPAAGHEEPVIARLPPHKRLAKALLDAAGVSVRRHKAWEAAAARDPARLEPFADGRPMPPPELITRVAGTPGQRWFSEHGCRNAELFTELAAAQGVALVRSDVLDLGCGCGRIARWLAPETTAAGHRFHGLDIQPPLVAWCAAHLPGSYAVNRLGAPLPLADAQVDVVYAYSVVTHLARATTAALLAECARVLRPGGLALVTYQDAAFGGGDVADAIAREGYVTSAKVGEGLNYLSAWTTPEALGALAAPGLEAVAVLPSDPQGGRQAVLTLRRRA